MRLKRSRKVRATVRELRSPQFIWGAVSGLIAALTLEAILGLVRNTLNHQVAGFYLVLIVALSCVTLVGYFLNSIQQLVENRNFTRFITSKSDRLNLMTQCIKRAKKSIYILSDLDDSGEETELDEHKKYLDALNQVINENMGNRIGFKFVRIVVPPRTLGKGADHDSNWIRDIRVTDPYRKHFELLHRFDPVALKYRTGPQDVKLMLIDDRYLFLKIDLTSNDEKALNSLLDGGIYLEDYSREGMSEFSECFRIMHGKGEYIEPEDFHPSKPQ